MFIFDFITIAFNFLLRQCQGKKCQYLLKLVNLKRTLRSRISDYLIKIYFTIGEMVAF